MTEQTQPTDAELLAEYDRVFNTTRTIDRHGVALRAVLAKWGTPAGAGEVVAWMDDFGNTFPLAANKGAGSWLDAHKRNWKPLYTTTQPTQAQAGAVPQHQPTPDVQAKMAVNQWDHFGDILPTLKAISRGDWYWGANSRCKYIEIRLDTRDGGCLLFDRERVRISPAQFAHQSHSVRMEPWPGIKGADHA